MAVPLDDASAILIEQLTRGEDPEYAASRALAEELSQEDLARVSRDEDRVRVDARIAFDLYRDRRAPPVALRTRRRSCADSKKLGALILGTIVDAIPNMFRGYWTNGQRICLTRSRKTLRLLQCGKQL